MKEMEEKEIKEKRVGKYCTCKREKIKKREKRITPNKICQTTIPPTVTNEYIVLCGWRTVVGQA